MLHGMPAHSPRAARHIFGAIAVSHTGKIRCRVKMLTAIAAKGCQNKRWAGGGLQRVRKRQQCNVVHTLASPGETLQPSFGLPVGDIRGFGLYEPCEKRSGGDAGTFIDPSEF